MKKLLTLLAICVTLNTSAQNTTTLPTSPLSVSFSPSFRYWGTLTDSLRQTWMQTPGGGWNRLVTMTEANLRYAPITGGGYKQKNDTVNAQGYARNWQLTNQLASYGKLSITNNWSSSQLFSGGLSTSTAAFSSGSYTGTLYSTTLTANRTWSLPDATGTLALTSDIPAGITYTLNAIYKGNGTTTPVASSIIDDGTNTTISDGLKLTGAIVSGGLTENILSFDAATGQVKKSIAVSGFMRGASLANYIPRAGTSNNTYLPGQIYDDGSFVGVGYSADPGSGNLFAVNGNTYLGGTVKLASLATGTTSDDILVSNAGVVKKIAGSNYKLSADSGNTANNYVTYGKYLYGATTQYNKTFVAPTLGVASATTLNITGTGGAGYINLKANGTGIPTPAVGSVNFYSAGTNSFAFKTNSGFASAFNSTSITADRALSIPDADGFLMINPLTTTGDITYLSTSSSIGKNVARLGIGSTGDVLTVSGGLPSWAAGSGFVHTTGTELILGLKTFFNATEFSNGFTTGSTGTIGNGTSLVLLPSSGTPNTPGTISFNNYGGTAAINIASPTITTGIKTQTLLDASGTLPLVVATYDLAGKTNVGAIFSYTPLVDGYYKLDGVMFTNSITTNTLRLRVEYTTPGNSTAVSSVGGLTSGATPSTSTGTIINNFIYAKAGVPIVVTTENPTGGGTQNYDIAARLLRY